jgi:hypothetical protein
MANHGLILKKSVAATDVVAYNRYAVAASSVNLDNGNVFRLDTCASSTSGCSVIYTEVWAVSAGSASGSTLNDMWMADSQRANLTVDGALIYSGLNDDPRKFSNVGGRVLDAWKPQKGDVVELSADCFSGARGANTYASSNGDVYSLVWNTSATAGNLSFHLLATTYFSIGTGGLGDTGRVTAYRMVCTEN